MPVASSQTRPTRLTRRSFLTLGAAAGAALLLPRSAGAAADLVDPFSGALPIVFPLASGTYQSPVADNWHAAREGSPYSWNHLINGDRAHDGVDIYPVSTALPAVYAPFSAAVAAICTRSSNRLDAAVQYLFDTKAPPPWDYSTAIDDAAGQPMYGNFVWLRSTDPRSAGYSVFYCHLLNEPLLQSLSIGQRLDSSTAVGRMGDTGNAQGTPQLHVELHYPAGSSFTCNHCTPAQQLTSFDPTASLLQAALR